MRLVLTLILALVPQLGRAQDASAALFGVWGSPVQCAGAPILPGGSVAHAPVRIGPDWFEQRGIWCRLTWFDPVIRTDGIYVKTRAQCGEDASRAYWLAFDLDTSGDAPRLTLIWDGALENGPMQICVSG